MPSSPSIRLPATAGLAALLLLMLAGCGGTPACKEGNQDYLNARERPRLRMPEGVTGSERLAGGTLVIPPVSATPDRLDPEPRCLDEPPPFFQRTAGARAGTPEEAVNVWAMAWAGRKADQVAAFYAPGFESGEAGGATAWLERRREDVASGAAAEPRLEDVRTTLQGDDRAVVTFVQRLGDDAVRRELTLVRDPQGWRIVAERTLYVQR